jgi:hypothetical protein
MNDEPLFDQCDSTHPWTRKLITPRQERTQRLELDECYQHVDLNEWARNAASFEADVDERRAGKSAAEYNRLHEEQRQSYLGRPE